MVVNNTDVTDLREPKDGYDLPLYGLANGTFYSFHIPAIVCIALSLACVVITLILSFRTQTSSSFFTKWSKSDRFVVYLALCDGLFNVSHITDHLHIVIAKQMVHPRWLCEFYGFNLTVSISAQPLMVNVIAVNIFLLIFFEKNVNFGKRDWRLLSWTYGFPVVAASIAAGLRQMGPNGAYCQFDGVRGHVARLLLTTVPILVIMTLNTVVYVLTLCQIHRRTRAFQVAGIQTVNQTINTARSMSLFVLAFIIQWWAIAVYGAWELFTKDVPQEFLQLVVTFSNIGGVLNLIVFIILRRRKLFENANVPGGDSETAATPNAVRY